MSRSRAGSRVLSALVCVMICFAVCFPAITGAAETAGSDEIRSVTGESTMFGLSLSWEYPYSDAFFLQPDDQYNHQLAQASLGLAVASTRHKDKPQEQEYDLVNLLERMGFSAFDTASYRTLPTPVSIGYGFAQKQIGGATVVACVVCGGNYGLEWASNLTIGETIRSEGFGVSGGKVQEALKAYLDAHPSGNPLKLWITGYSRGGAVANVLAADCTASGEYESVYAYTFATPRTTREPIAYPNIFNIIQKEDIVPKVPLYDWGYERYGIDRYLVSPLTDADCAAVMERTAENYRRMAGSEMVTNPEIDYEVRTILDYLLSFLPESRIYAQHLQPLAVEIMSKNGGTGDALKVLLETLQRYEMQHRGSNRELKQLLDYLITLIDVQHFQNRAALPPDQWNPDLGSLNLFHAHLATEYVAKMFASDDPGELYSDSLDYIRLMVYGDADITIMDGSTVLKQILADGTELAGGVPAPNSFPDARWSEGKTVITLPADRSLTVKIESKAALPQTVTCTGFRASGRTVRAKVDRVYSYLLNAGETAVIRTAADGGVIEADSAGQTDVSVMVEPLYSPTTAMRLENNQVLNITISGFTNWILLLTVVLLLQLIISLILLLFRRMRNRKRNKTAALIWHAACAVVFAILEGAMWYLFPHLPMIRMIPGILAFAAIVLYALKGCLSVSHDWKAFRIFLGVLTACMVLQSLLLGDYTTGKAMLLIVFYILATAAACMILWRKSVD